MSGKLLDTNAVIALQDSDPAIMSLFDADDEILIPSVVIGEPSYGAYNSNRVDANLVEIDEFIAANAVLECDAATGKLYGQIRHRLKVRRRPIPDNDIWIAAIALQHGLTLLTRDEHFRHIDGLKTETW